MKSITKHLLFVFQLMIGPVFIAQAQEWVFQIDIQVRHDYFVSTYISSGTITYSGQVRQVIGYSPFTFTFRGTAPPSGDLMISFSGIAIGKQVPGYVDPTPISGSYDTTYRTENCLGVSFIRKNGDVRFTGSYSYFLSPVISTPNYSSFCDSGFVSFTGASPCHLGTLQWGIATIAGGPFSVVPGLTGTSFNLTRAIVAAMGFSTATDTFYVAVRGHRGIFSTSSQVTFYHPPPSIAVSKTDPNCHNGNGSVSVTITPSNSAIRDFLVYLFPNTEGAADAVVSINSNNHTFPNYAPGDYYVQVINDTNKDVFGNCGTERTANQIVISNPPAMTVSLEPTHVTCNGYSNGAIQLSTTNASGAITCNWADIGNGPASRNNIFAGNYSVTVTDNKNCTASSNVVVAQLPAMSVVATAPANYRNGTYHVSCPNNTDGSITTTVSGRPPGTGFTYVWNNGANGASLQNVGAGTYNVTVTDGNNCQAYDDVTLTAPAAINFSMFVSNGISCPGATTGSMNPTTITNTYGGLTYQWSSGETTANIFNKGAGNYSLTITDGNGSGCSTTKYETLSDPAPYSTQISAPSNYHGSDISCDGESDGSLSAVLIDPSGSPVPATSYSWDRNNVPWANGAVINNLDAGSYRVVATYGNNCSAQSTFLLNDPGPVLPGVSPISNYNGFPISCNGASDGILLANATGGTAGAYTFQWTDGPAAAQYGELVAGTYFVTATDINGCVGSTSYQLEDPLQVTPVINATSNYNGQTLSCTGAADGVLTATVSGGVSPYNFLWSNNSLANNAQNLAAGIYSVLVTDNNGCQGLSMEVEIEDPEPVTAQIDIASNYNGMAIRCHGNADGSIVASGSGGTGIYYYQWNTNATTNLIAGLPAALYSVVVSDQNNCHDAAEITLVNPEPVQVALLGRSDFNGYGVQCDGFENGFIEVTAAGGTNTFTYQWPTLAETTYRVQNLGAGSYTVIATDGNGCTAEMLTELTQPPPLDLNIVDFTDPTCYAGTNGTVTLQANGGILPFEFSLNSTDWQTEPVFNSLIANSQYSFISRDQNQCVASFQLTLSQPSKIEVDFTIQPAFCHEPVGAVSAEVAGGTGDYNYQWTSSKAEDFGHYSSITKINAGLYTLQVKDEADCIVEAIAAIPSVNGPKAQVAESKSTSCYDSQDGYAKVEITEGDGPFTITWSDGSTAWSRTNLSRGNHFATVTDGNECTTGTFVTTLSPQPLKIEFEDLVNASCFSICDGSARAVVVGGNGDNTFLWNAEVGNELKSGLCAGDYNLEVVDKLGCSASAVLQIVQPEKLELKPVAKKLPLCKGDCNGEIQLVANGGNGDYVYEWDAGSHSDVQANLCAGSHAVTVHDTKNCSTSVLVDLGQPASVEVVEVQNTPPVCHDGDNGVLAVAAYGGSGNYTFNWSNGTQGVLNDELTPGNYSVEVLDQNNCAVNKSLIVANVPALIFNLGGGVTVCEGQIYQLNAGNTWSKVEWSNAQGWLAATSEIAISQPGVYTAEVTDRNNCSATDSFVLETSEDLLQAAMILASAAFAKDTVVVIDVSWPLPDKITWTLPSALIKLSDQGERVDGIFELPGEYTFTLNATLGDCHDEISRTITILESSVAPSGGRLGLEEFVKDFTLHPNPNSGSFDVEVTFIEESPVTLSVWNVVNSVLLAKVDDDGKAHYEKHFDLGSVSAGTYILRLDYHGGSRTIRFLIH